MSLKQQNPATLNFENHNHMVASIFNFLDAEYKTHFEISITEFIENDYKNYYELEVESDSIMNIIKLNLIYLILKNEEHNYIIYVSVLLISQ